VLVVSSAHVGGLLALFLGASFITALEILDVMLGCACRRRADGTTDSRNRNRNRKSPAGTTTGSGNASNHVMFRPVASESLDE